MSQNKLDEFHHFLTPLVSLVKLNHRKVSVRIRAHKQQGSWKLGDFLESGEEPKT